MIHIHPGAKQVPKPVADYYFWFSLSGVFRCRLAPAHRISFLFRLSEFRGQPPLAAAESPAFSNTSLFFPMLIVGQVPLLSLIPTHSFLAARDFMLTAGCVSICTSVFFRCPGREQVWSLVSVYLMLSVTRPFVFLSDLYLIIKHHSRVISYVARSLIHYFLSICRRNT